MMHNMNQQFSRKDEESTMRTPIGGLMPILATPFRSDGSLDLEGLRAITEFQLESGVSAVAVFGLASEGFALTRSERAQILAEVRGVTAGAVPIIAGVNGTSTVTSIEQAREAEENGADALMVLPPFMVKPPAGTLVDFYQHVSQAIALPVMVQDAPAMTGVNMPVAVIADISRLPGVTSVKVEAPPTVPKVQAVVAAVAPDFAVVGGQNAQFCLDEYDRGSIGTMPACEFSDLLAAVLADWAAGSRDDAYDGFRRLLPLILFGLQPGLAWAVHKEVLVARGLIESAYVRYPASPIDDPARRSLADVLASVRLPALQRTVTL
jgi:dihydrodipicolinate synthase/N-acetylneuraminate lyase